MASTSSSARVKEYSIIVPKNGNKKYHVMRFNANLGVEFDKWTQVKMERENNSREFKSSTDTDMPRFGAGSEFAREARDEARRKKLGIIAKKYNPEDQPWILKSSGSTVKKFKGIREGGVSENAAYYVFTHAANNVIQAFPLNEWYNFQPIQRYKALSVEEAEQEFSKRNKHLNYFSLMLRKRLKGDEDAVVDGEGGAGEEGKGKAKKAKKDLTISEMDEWMDSSDDDDDDDDEDNANKEDESGGSSKRKNAKSASGKKKKKRDTDLEAFEDSDDGDGEGKEQDYITDSSESEPENAKLEGVAEEKALRKLLNSDDEDNSDSEQSEREEKDDAKDKEEESDDKSKDALPAKNKKKKANKKDAKKEAKESAKKDDMSDFSSDSSTDEEASKKRAQKRKREKKEPEEKSGEKKGEKEPDTPSSSRSASPISETGKRKAQADASPGPSTAGTSNAPTPPPPTKKVKLESLVNYIPGAAEAGITEDAVRKYLMRKPMTTTELLQKFKSKKTGLSSEQLVNIMTQILKKINPVKQMLKGKMYLSIKP